MSAVATTRRADPWRDLDVIDRNGPRTNQAWVGLMTAAALATGAWWLVAIVAAQLAIGLTLGRRWCVPCVFYFVVLQPRLGEGELEDARAPRFANMIAVTLTGAATLLFALDVTGVAWALTGVVAAVALFSAVSGFCVGCWIYARVWGCETCELPAR